jgi:hypothetical protein
MCIALASRHQTTLHTRTSPSPAKDPETWQRSTAKADIPQLRLHSRRLREELKRKTLVGNAITKRRKVFTIEQGKSGICERYGAYVICGPETCPSPQQISHVAVPRGVDRSVFNYRFDNVLEVKSLVKLHGIRARMN